MRSMLATFGTLSVDRLTEDFGVSLETIRRDLMETKESGELRRVRGGVVPVAKDKEAPCQLRTAVRSREKRAIARAAAAMVEAGQTILSTREARQLPWPNAQLRWKGLLSSPTL
ncbi:DeoR family transcriptional regulator [Bradyrhizobium pachyrhizi]